MATTHYPIGGSTIELTGYCPGSVKAREPYKNAPAGEAAERGTRIHKYVEIAWRQEFKGYKLVKADKDFLKRLSVDESKVGDALFEAMKATAANHGFRPSELCIEEQRSFRGEIAGGTSDADGHKPMGDMLMGDVKTGFVQVSPEQNVQEIFYAVTKWKSLPAFERDTLENVHCVIWQPEAPDSPVIETKTWSMPASELPKWEATFDEWIDRAVANPDLRIAGDHCKNCPAAGKCKEYRALKEQESDNQIARLEAGMKIEPGKGAELAKQYAEVPAIRDFAKSLTKYADMVEGAVKQALRTAPDAVPGFVLEDSLGNRAFGDEKALLKAAKERGLSASELKTSKLISPNQLEILCKTKNIPTDWIAEFVTRPVSGQTIKEGQAKTLEEMFGGAI